MAKAKAKAKTEIEPEFDIEKMSVETMLGDLMKCVIEQYKALTKPWQAMTEAQQRVEIERAENYVRDAITKAVTIISVGDYKSIDAHVESVTFKQGVKAVIQLPRGVEGVHDLADSEGQVVKIVIANTEGFLSNRGKPKEDPDQAEIYGLGEEYID